MSRGEARLGKDDPSIAGVRFAERETERKELQVRLTHPESRQEEQCLTVKPVMIQVLLGEMRESLGGTDIKAKQGLLRKVVVGVELGNERGKVAYFPLHDEDLYTAPPGECEQQDRTVSYHSTCDAVFEFYVSLSPASVRAEWKTCSAR